MSEDSTPLSSSPTMASSLVEQQSSLFSSFPESPIADQPTNDKSGMKRDIYLAAGRGDKDELLCHNNWKEQKTPTGNNVLHIHVGMPLNSVASHNVDIRFIQYVLDETAESNSLLFQTNDKCDTPLHFAARFGHEIAVKEFLNRPEVGIDELLNKTNQKKDTALHDAARGCHASIVKLLIDHQNVLAQMPKPNALGETPLFLAAERKCAVSFCTILAHTDLAALHHQGPYGLTPLHAAVLWRRRDFVDRIMKRDTSGSLMRIKNEQGQTPLHCCAAKYVEPQHPILSILIKHDNEYNSAAYIQDNEGRTALHIAILKFNFKAAKMLMDHYPDCTEIVDNKGQNVVHYAAKSGRLSAFKWFLTEMPECDNLVNEKDNDGNTPLHLLAAAIPSDRVFYRDWSNRLPYLIKQHKILDKRVFNNKNLTAGDIIFSNDSFCHRNPRTHPGRELPKARRIINYDTGITRIKREEITSRLRKVGETRLVVAALIVTVSFTAAFTVPGGFDQTPGENTGLAVLAKKAAFKAFLTSDAIAFMLSSLATMLYFLIANLKDLPALVRWSNVALFLNYLSLGALMIAFVTGVYSAVSEYLGLALILISSIFFFPYLKVLAHCSPITYYIIEKLTFLLFRGFGG